MKYHSEEALAVEKILTEYGQKFFEDEELTIVADEDFLCNIPGWFEDLDAPEICFCIEGEVDNDPFSTYVRENFKIDFLSEISDFMFGFLHEIGHFLTITKELYDEDRMMRNSYYAFLNSEKENYFNLPAEKAATAWALDYLVNNLEEVKGINEQLKPYIYK